MAAIAFTVWSGCNSLDPADLATTALAYWQRWFPEDFDQRRPFTDRFALPPWWPLQAERFQQAAENRRP